MVIVIGMIIAGIVLFFSIVLWGTVFSQQQTAAPNLWERMSSWVLDLFRLG